MVSSLSAGIFGKFRWKLSLPLSQISNFLRSSSSSTAPVLHIRAKTYSRSKCALDNSPHCSYGVTLTLDHRLFSNKKKKKRGTYFSLFEFLLLFGSHFVFFPVWITPPVKQTLPRAWSFRELEPLVVWVPAACWCTALRQKPLASPSWTLVTAHWSCRGRRRRMRRDPSGPLPPGGSVASTSPENKHNIVATYTNYVRCKQQGLYGQKHTITVI